MPFNEKGEWVNVEDSHKERDEYIGYRVCSCKDGVELLQAGFEVETHICSLCKREVADASEFFMNDGVEMLSK